MILLLKIVSIFAALVLFLRYKLNISLSIFLLTLYMVVIFGVNARAALSAGAKILVSEPTLRLIVIIVMVLFIAAVLKARKLFDKLISSLNSIIRDSRIVALIAPALIGFLPMPGGALVSAPLVDVSTKKMNLKPEFNTFLNFWFRHVWEFVWPVYAGLLIFHEYSGISLKTIILYQSPFTILTVALGAGVAFFYFRKHGIKREKPTDTMKLSKSAVDFFKGFWPILLVILLFFILSIPLYLSLVLVSVVVAVVLRVSLKEMADIFRSKTVIQSVILIATVMVFQQIIEISGAFSTLSTMNVPKSMIIGFCFLVSFSMGFLTGVNTSFIVIAYPILRPLFDGVPGIDFVYMSLYVYVIGFAGILASPVHLCLVLTNEYFKSSLSKVYRYLAPPVLILSAVSTLLIIIL